MFFPLYLAIYYVITITEKCKFSKHISCYCEKHTTLIIYYIVCSAYILQRLHLNQSKINKHYIPISFFGYFCYSIHCRFQKKEHVHFLNMLFLLFNCIRIFFNPTIHILFIFYFMRLFYNARPDGMYQS